MADLLTDDLQPVRSHHSTSLWRLFHHYRDTLPAECPTGLFTQCAHIWSLADEESFSVADLSIQMACAIAHLCIERLEHIHLHLYLLAPYLAVDARCWSPCLCPSSFNGALLSQKSLRRGGVSPLGPMLLPPLLIPRHDSQNTTSIVSTSGPILIPPKSLYGLLLQPYPFHSQGTGHSVSLWLKSVLFPRYFLPGTNFFSRCGISSIQPSNFCFHGVGSTCQGCPPDSAFSFFCQELFLSVVRKKIEKMDFFFPSF